MNKLIARVMRAAWTYRQPLARMPAVTSAPISDLFVWRKGGNWRTWFELTDAASLFDAGSSSHEDPSIRVLLFDAAGRKFAEHELQAPRFKRLQVEISSLAAGCSDDVGVFCVLHPATPQIIEALGSHLVERGYVGYSYCNAPLRSYVHGNFDAVSMNGRGELERLAGTSVLTREYRLQHLLAGSGIFEIALVNPSNQVQKIVFEVLAVDDGRKLHRLNAMLPTGGCHVFRVVPGDVAKRIVIRSHLVMARPLIFHIKEKKLDVLHG